MDEILEQPDENKPVEVSQSVKTLAIFAYIGNGFWALVIMVILFWALGDPRSFERELELVVDEKAALIVGILVLLSVFVVSIIGVVQMTKGKKAGFWMYAISNGLWVLVGFLAGTPQNIIVAAISLGFIIGFGAQLKNLR